MFLRAPRVGGCSTIIALLKPLYIEETSKEKHYISSKQTQKKEVENYDSNNSNRQLEI